MNDNKKHLPRSRERSLRRATVALICCISVFPGISPAEEQSPKEQTPIHILPFQEKEGASLKFGSAGGGNFSCQTFQYNPNTKVSEPAMGNVQLTQKGVPVPATTGISCSPTISLLYANTLWDLGSYPYPQITLGSLYSITGEELGHIRLSKGKTSTLYISKDYVVSPEGSGSVEKDGPFADVTFTWNAAKPQVSKGSRLLVTRNGKEIENCDVDPMKTITLALGRVASTNDVIDWLVKDANGVMTHKNLLAFPVVGSAPGLVEYGVTIAVMNQVKD